jgi:Spy/CpxP family protein refolding chaperone
MGQAVFAAAQTPAPLPHPFAELQRILARLDLTNDQKTQIQTIIQSAEQQMKAVVANTSLTKDQQKSQIESIHKSAVGEIESVLTPDQKKKMEVIRAEIALGIPLEKIHSLGLTADQKTQIHSIVQTALGQLRAIRQNASLSFSQRQQQIAALRQATMSQILNVLTAAQKQQLGQTGSGS